MRRFSRFLIISSAALVLLGALFVAGETAQRAYVYSKLTGTTEVLRPLKDTLKTIYFNLRPSSEFPQTAPVVKLKVAPKVLRKLESLRSKVHSAGISRGIPLDYYRAQMHLNGEWQPVKLRLRGLMADHFIPTRASLKIKLVDAGHYKGMREFHLMDPYDKGLTADHVYFEYLKSKGFTTLYNEFTRLEINGKTIGFFQLFEAVGKTAFTRNNRHEAVLSKFYNIGKNKVSSAQLIRFRDCINQVTDCSDAELLKLIHEDQFAWALALSLVAGSYHAWDQNNLLVYYDPTTAKVSLIPWDWGIHALDKTHYPNWELPPTYHVASRLLALPGMHKKRNQMLKRIFMEWQPALVKNSQKLFQELMPFLALDNRHLNLEVDKNLQAKFIQTLGSNISLLRQHKTLNQHLVEKTERPAPIVLGPGRVEIKTTRVFPVGTPVKFAAGLELIMHPQTSLLIRGNFEARGSAEKPIRIHGTADQQWGGIAVVGQSRHLEMAEITYLIMRGGQGVDTALGPFSGSLSIHNMQLRMSHSQFHSSQAIDSVNVKSARVFLADNQFTGSRDDLLDLDFVNGVLQNNRFEKSGGDCVDFSGSQVRMLDNQMQDCSDKGISAGERSRILAVSNQIQNVQTGVAIKDGSNLVMRNSNISQAMNGLSVYIKKPHFPLPRAQFENIQLRDIRNPLIQLEKAKVRFENVTLYSKKEYRLPAGIRQVQVF